MIGIGTTFRSGEPSLLDILEKIHKGEKQLPDFQRGWVWDDNHIRSLIASVSMSYPIGAVMLMETGGEGVRFRPRTVEGVILDTEIEPQMLILDGQQRLTSLYLALHSLNAVPTRTDKGIDIKRYYYLDIEKCLDPDEDRFDAILSISEDRKITSDFGRKVDLDISSQELEFESGLFPLSIIFDPPKYSSWRRGYQRKFRHDDNKLDKFDEFESLIIQRFQQYRVPTIELLRDTPKEAVCQVFEKVNTGGVSLTVFELITATFAADDYNLRDDWRERKNRLYDYGPLKGVDSTDFLTSITLLSSYQRHKNTGSSVSCKRKDVLRLTLDEYKFNCDLLEEGMIKTARLLIREKIFDDKSIPYQTQLIPLSAICTILGDRFEDDAIKNKLLRWYWCGVLGELYGGANETRYALDIQDVLSWIEDSGNEPRTIRDANFNPLRLLSLQTRLSAAYKGLMVQLMKQGGLDFLNGDPIDLTLYFDRAVDIHHIFPKAYCQSQGYSKSHWNSIVNKAPLTARTNRIIGGKAPSIYIESIEKNHKIETERMDEIMKTHLINPAFLRADDFNAFFINRAAYILDLISNAMRKQVTGRDSEEIINAFGASLALS
ncbi:DUF262 [Desulfonema limicola]|uniref:DUF262 n=1 Tax=Desulfonema limicola TaxID=45656 RepID=A0A975GG63_9BACT|nr:DUF262 domain-containing protein [Desulfonema limicola]QTA79918.1 DUF262 [Desulfonema limicola]